MKVFDTVITPDGRGVIREVTSEGYGVDIKAAGLVKAIPAIIRAIDSNKREMVQAVGLLKVYKADQLEPTP